MNKYRSLVEEAKRWVGVKLFPPEPIRCKCGAADWTLHQSETLGGGFWHHGALGRRGRVCNKCIRVYYNETDQQYYDHLPKWLQTDPELIVPDGVVRKEKRTEEIQNGKQIQTYDI